MSRDLPTRPRAPHQLLRLHDELDDLVSAGSGWKWGPLAAVILATFVFAVVRLGLAVGIGLEFGVALVASFGILTALGIAQSVRAGSLRRAIRRLEERSAGPDPET